jgi:hypothetical protein
LLNHDTVAQESLVSVPNASAVVFKQLLFMDVEKRGVVCAFELWKSPNNATNKNPRVKFFMGSFYNLLWLDVKSVVKLDTKD